MATFEPSNPLCQRVSFNNQNHVYHPKSALSSESDEANEYDQSEEETDETPPERVVHTSINAATSRRQISPIPKAYLPPTLVKFHDDFRKSFGLPQDRVPANPTDVDAEPVVGQPEANQTEPFPVSDQTPSSVVPAKRRGVAYVKPSKKARSNEPASSAGEERLEAGKARPPKPKGTGIYKTGTWAYAPDEDQGVEKMTKAAEEIKAISDAFSHKPAKLTRNAFRNLKSEAVRQSVGTTPSQEPPTSRERSRVSGSPRVSKTLSPRRGSSATPSRPESARRKSNRARIIPNYSHVPNIETDEDASTPRSTSENAATGQGTRVALGTPISQESTPALDQSSRSKSSSAHQASELNSTPLAKPKKSWTHIVYEVLANSKTTTLTLQEIGEAIMDRFPFFKSNPSILKSSPRNPLYCHPAFYKVTREDKSLAWGIKAGQYYDKRTNKLLTAGSPGPDIVPSIELSEQIVAETQQDVDVSEVPSSVPHSVEVEMKQDEPVRSPSLAANETEEVQDETQSGSVTRRVIEIDPRDIPDENMVSPRNVQRSTPPPSTATEIEVKSTPQPTGSVFPQSRDQRRLEGLVHQNLIDTFTSEQMGRFLQETKLCYFKNMALKKEDVHRILDTIFPSGFTSSDENVETCTTYLRKDYEDRIWSSDWFIKFVTEEVTRFDINMEGFMQHMDRPRPIRLDFWAASTRYKRQNFAELFSAFSDTIDLDRVWMTKPWYEFGRKVFQTACDATYEHRLEPGCTVAPNKVLAKVQAAIHERYPDRSSPMWDVPRVHRLPTAETHSRKASVTSTNSNRRPGSAGGLFAGEGIGDFSRAGSVSNKPSSPLVPNSQETLTSFTPLNGATV